MQCRWEMRVATFVMHRMQCIDIAHNKQTVAAVVALAFDVASFPVQISQSLVLDRWHTSESLTTSVYSFCTSE